MSDVDEFIESEEQIPKLVEKAIRQAVAAAVAAGRSILVTQNETLFEVYPDGTSKVIKRLDPMTRVAKGQKRRLPE